MGGIGGFGEQWLSIGISATKGVEPDGLGAQIDLTSDESVRPGRVDGKGAPQKASPTAVVGTAQEDDGAFRGNVEITLPMLGESLSVRRRILSLSGSQSAGEDVFGGLCLECQERGVLKTHPDLGLPAAVVAFDSGLKAWLSRRHEDGDDSQRQAGSDDAAQSVGPAMGSIEPAIVVELGVTRQAELPPVLEEGLDCLPRGDAGAYPGSCQGTVKRDDVEHLHIDAAANDKAADNVEAIQLRLPIRHVGQIPASWRRGTADPAPSIQDSSPQQDPSDGADGRHGGCAVRQQFPMDRGGPNLPQVALRLKRLSNGDDSFFQFNRDTIGRAARTARSIAPVHAIQPLVSGSIDPSSDCRAINAEPAGNLSNRSTAPNRTDHGTAPRRRRVFFSSSVLESSSMKIISRVPTNILTFDPEPASPKLWKLTGCGKPTSTSPSHTPWKTLRVSHISHSSNSLPKMVKDLTKWSPNADTPPVPKC